MTLFFNLDKLEKASNNNPVKFVQLLKDFHNKKLPKNKYTKQVSLTGISFLLHPDKLLTTNIDIMYIVQYIKLAARRDYALYKQYGSKTLILSYYPDINLVNIKTNPLLKITETEIHFLYEE